MRIGLISAGLLVAGLVLMAFSQGAAPAAWAAVPSAILLLCYLDRTPSSVGLIILFPLFLATYCIAWFGVVPNAPAVIYIAIVVVYGIPYFIPFVAHRLLTPACPAWMRVLIFPSAWVSVEYALQALSPYGSWMSLAYSQDASGALAQIASLGGVPLVTFFLTAIAAAAALIITSADQSRERLVISLLGIIVAATCLLGWSEYDIRAYRPTRTVMVGGVLADHSLQEAANTTMVEAKRPLSADSMKTIRVATDALNTRLLKDTARAASSGARIVAWPEASGLVRDGDEPALLNQASQVARDHGIYLFAAYIVWRPGQPLPIENKIAAIDPAGRVAWTFLKSHPIAALEDARDVRGGADLALLDTRYGRIALAICHDFDFPEQVRRAARGADLMIDPSNDWPAIEWLHANMHRYRAIENGIPIFRPTDHGASVVADRLGRVQFWQSSSQGGSAYVFAAPIGATRTLYSSVGGWLAWIAGIMLALAMILKTRVMLNARRTA